MIKQLFTATRIEILKYKRSYAIALATLAPLLIAGMVTIIYFSKADRLVEPGTNGIESMLQNSLSISANMLFPFYLILLTILVHQIEFKSQSLKDLLSYPVSYFATYNAKWSMAFILIFISLALYSLFSLLGIWILSLKHPDLFWLDLGIFLTFAKNTILVALSCLFLMGIQFLVALRYSNSLVPFGVGVVGFISAGILIQGWKHIHFHPYALGMMTFQNIAGRTAKELSFYLAYSLIGVSMLYVLGYFMWSRRRIV